MAYLEFLVKFLHLVLGYGVLFLLRWVVVKHAGSHNGTSIFGLPTREVNPSSTPQLIQEGGDDDIVLLYGLCLVHIGSYIHVYLTFICTDIHVYMQFKC